jgi:DNA-binding HxlR family transcriptional regulator
VKRTSFATDECPVARSVEAVGHWWSLLIVRDAFTGKRRFGEFQKSLGVAKNILTARLKKLVADGVLELVPASDGSTYREYALTEKGRAAPRHCRARAVGLWRIGGPAGGPQEGQTGEAGAALRGRAPARPGRRTTGSRARGVIGCASPDCPAANIGFHRARTRFASRPGLDARESAGESKKGRLYGAAPGVFG